VRGRGIASVEDSLAMTEGKGVRLLRSRTPSQ
jgi:hypothetical protein